MPDLGAIGRSSPFEDGRINVLMVRAGFASRTSTVSGIVYDQAGAPCARVVRAHRRSDGFLLVSTVSNAITGAYSLACTTDEVYRVVLDDAAGTLLNDLVDRVIPG